MAQQAERKVLVCTLFNKPKAKYSGEYLQRYFLLDAIPRTMSAYSKK